MTNQTSQLTEQRILAFALGHPGLGPRRITQERWGGIAHHRPAAGRQAG